MYAFLFCFLLFLFSCNKKMINKICIFIIEFRVALVAQGDTIITAATNIVLFTHKYFLLTFCNKVIKQVHTEILRQTFYKTKLLHERIYSFPVFPPIFILAKEESTGRYCVKTIIIRIGGKLVRPEWQHQSGFYPITWEDVSEFGVCQGQTLRWGYTSLIHFKWKFLFYFFHSLFIFCAGNCMLIYLLI